MKPPLQEQPLASASLRSLGPATLEDLRMLGVDSLSALAASDPAELYARLCHLRGCRVDICCLDMFICLVAQARNPYLPPEQKDWFWWSRQRKARAAGNDAGAGV